MKAPDISKTFIVQRFGVGAAKLYGAVWFSFLYIMLVPVTAGFWVAGQEIADGWRQIGVSCFFGVLVVFAASHLTRMRLKFLSEMAELESPEKSAIPFMTTQTQNRSEMTERSSNPNTVIGFAVLGLLVAGIVGVVKAFGMKSGLDVLLCLLDSVVAFGAVYYVYYGKR
jgi:hypothetical protein